MPAYPTISEVVGRQWRRLPPLLRALLPAVLVTFVVLMTANYLIRARIYELTTENLAGQHREALSEIGNAFDEFLSNGSVYLASLANRDGVKACAQTSCADKNQSDTVFRPELVAKLNNRDLYFIEVGFINPRGQQTARAIRASGNIPLAPGDLPMFQVDPTALERLRTLPSGEIFIFPISRDVRISPSESYQQPAVRIALPVTVGDQRAGYVTAVLGLDDFFTAHFVPSESQLLMLLDTERCVVASSDLARHATLYKTWSNLADRPCYRDLPVQDWDIIAQPYGDSVFSTRVISSGLILSGQSWTIVIQQPTGVAYAQANTLSAFMTLVHLVTVLLVAGLVVATDRGRKRIFEAANA